MEYMVHSNYTLLEYAVILKNPGIVTLLLDYGADPNFLHEKLYSLLCSPLLRAAELESPEMVRLLLDAGTHVDPINRYDGRTPLAEAVKRNNLEIARMLLEAGAMPENQFSIRYRGNPQGSYIPLTWAVNEKKPDMVKLLIEMGADINLSVKAGGWGNATPTALTQAAANGDMDMFNLLIHLGADINTPGGSGFSPLQTAIRNGHTDIALELINMDAKVNTTTGIPSLLLAARNGNVPLMRVLLEKGADVFATDEGWYTTGTVLSYAAEGVRDRATFAEILNLIREWGFTNVNYKAAMNWTALHSAAKHSNYEAAKMLIERGAHISAVTEEGLTPLHYALYDFDRSSDDREEDDILLLAKLLIDSGASVNNIGPEQRFSLSYGEGLYGRFYHLMLNFGKPRIIEMLIKAGAVGELPDPGSQSSRPLPEWERDDYWRISQMGREGYYYGDH